MLYDQQCQQSFEIAHSLTWIGLRTSGLACLYVNGQKIQSGMIGYVVTIKVPHLRILFELVEVDEHQNLSPLRRFLLFRSPDRHNRQVYDTSLGPS